MKWVELVASAALGFERLIPLGRALSLSTLLACSSSPDVVAQTGPGTGPTYDPANPPKVLTLTGSLDVRDPTIAAGDRFYLFHTGAGIASKVSPDLLNWQVGPRIFDENPAWIEDEVPGVSELWSPGVATFGGAAHLYYAASVFGTDRSCIGHAKKPSLDSTEAWTDEGPVVCSNTGTQVDDWNAIDPEVLLVDGEAWLVLGSYQSGIKLLKLDAAGARADAELYSLAARPAGSAAVQQAFLLKRGGYYYLFSSFDSCCRGVDSTHKIMVGRATAVSGPYLDRMGTALLEGGGTLVLAGNDRFHGPGSNAVLHSGGTNYHVYHAYDANNMGRPTLRIAELAWDDAGWPVSGGP